MLLLAKLHGVQPSFTDAFCKRRQASVESMARVLETMGSPAGTEAQARASLRERITELTQRRLEPVSVAWIGKRASVWLRIERRSARGAVRCALTLESGETAQWSAEVTDLPSRERTGPDGKPETRVRIDLPRKLEVGYHRLSVEFGGERLETLVISAPVKSFRFPASEKERASHAWGLFCPVYAIRNGSELGVGDLSGLRNLASWSASHGGRVVATLPLLAANLTEPFDPSPYAPVSRIFWNELFADPSRAPEFEWCEEARALAHSAPFLAETRALREEPLVEYRRAAAHHRRLVEAMARRFFASGADKSEEFKAFKQQNPLLEEYAAFRAVTERQGVEWIEWPARLRKGQIKATDSDPEARRYHIYAQYLVARQLDELTEDVRSRGGLVYLDLPVGVSPYGFDVWRNQGLFAMGCATGAPPDPYFTGGQNWGFPPMKPEAMRAEGYATFIDALRAHMARSDYLRLDHVMAFHRLFWIPDEGTAADGVYVRYEAEELYAILSLESHRNQCRLVGENLGTVPPEVNKALDRHDLCGLYVAQYEMQPSATRALRPIPANCVASMNTHDMPPFAKFWNAGDVDDRIALDMLEARSRAGELQSRERTKTALIKFLSKKGLLGTGASASDAAAVRDGVLEFLATSQADFVLVNIEDLWLETNWQNVPGTETEHPNWRRRLRFTLDELRSHEGIAGALRWIDGLRHGKSAPKPVLTPGVSADKRRRGRQAAVKC